MALLVRGTRANGNTRGLLIAGILVCKGERVLIGVVIVLGVCAMGNTRGLLIADIPEHNCAELMTGFVTVHGVQRATQSCWCPAA